MYLNKEPFLNKELKKGEGTTTIKTSFKCVISFKEIMETELTCSNCAYGMKRGFKKTSDKRDTKCRRYPTSAYKSNSQWCGEHKTQQMHDLLLNIQHDKAESFYGNL